jgi:non-ribosomal peptide synthetase component F
MNVQLEALRLQQEVLEDERVIDVTLKRVLMTNGLNVIAFKVIFRLAADSRFMRFTELYVDTQAFELQTKVAAGAVYANADDWNLTLLPRNIEQLRGRDIIEQLPTLNAKLFTHDVA